MGFSLVVVSENYSLVAAHRLPTAVACLVVEHSFLGAWASAVAGRGPNGCGSQDSRTRLNSCGTWA